MTTAQQPMPAGAQRPGATQGPPPQGMVLQHAHSQQPPLVPMMQNPGATHFVQGPNFPPQIPLQHQRPLMNGLPPNANPNFPNIHNPNTNAAAAAAARQQAQLRQLQSGMAPGNALAHLGPYQPQLQPSMHPQQFQQMQHFQQANPGLRLTPQHQLIPGQHLIPQQALAAPGLQQMVPQGPQPLVTARYALSLGLV
jgi:hypothetical protein